jgi:orotidine-5'-phosphate decarboxylase
MTQDNPIYVALDRMDVFHARNLGDELRGLVGGLKIGLTFYLRYGDTATRYVTAGHDWFLDLKFNDIPNQVDGAVRAAVQLGPRFISIHESGGTEMMQAAVVAAHEEADTLKLPRPRILAVTTLTSLPSTPAQILQQAYHAQNCGCDGVIHSAAEAALLRSELRSDLILMTPGIRLDGYAVHDHRRSATPRQAIDAGVDYFVIGRPITQANEPQEVVKQILATLE